MTDFLADITVGFDAPYYTFHENTNMSSVTINFNATVVQPLDFFSPPVGVDCFILAYSHDDTAVGKQVHRRNQKSLVLSLAT